MHSGAIWKQRGNQGSNRQFGRHWGTPIVTESNWTLKDIKLVTVFHFQGNSMILLCTPGWSFSENSNHSICVHVMCWGVEVDFACKLHCVSCFVFLNCCLGRLVNALFQDYLALQGNFLMVTDSNWNLNGIKVVTCFNSSGGNDAYLWRCEISIPTFVPHL